MSCTHTSIQMIRNEETCTDCGMILDKLHYDIVDYQPDGLHHSSSYYHSHHHHSSSSSSSSRYHRSQFDRFTSKFVKDPTSLVFLKFIYEQCVLRFGMWTRDQKRNRRNFVQNKVFLRIVSRFYDIPLTDFPEYKLSPSLEIQETIVYELLTL